MLAMLWNIIENDLGVTEAVLQDDTMALLYIGQHSAGEGLTKEDTQACIYHFSPYMEWRGMTIKCNFQALSQGLRNLIRAYKARSQKTLRG